MEIRLNLEEITGFLYSMPNDTESERLSIRGDVNILPDSAITYARREFDVSSGNVNFGGRNFLDAQIEANRTFTLRTGQSVSQRRPVSTPAPATFVLRRSSFRQS